MKKHRSEIHEVNRESVANLGSVDIPRGDVPLPPPLWRCHLYVIALPHRSAGLLDGIPPGVAYCHAALDVGFEAFL